MDHCWILYFNKIARFYLFPRSYLPQHNNILIFNNIYRENSSLLREICVLSGSHSEISAESGRIEMYASLLLLFAIITIWDSFIIFIIIIIIIIIIGVMNVYHL